MNVNKHESTKTLKRRKKSMQNHINKHHSECHSVKVSHLSIMLSLCNLAKSSMFKDHTQFIAAEPDVDFDDICDTQQDEHAIDVQNHHYPMANLPLPRIDESQYQIKYNVQLTPSMLYQIDLEHTLRRHRNVDLSLHDEINEVMERHASRGVKLSESKVINAKDLLKSQQRYSISMNPTQQSLGCPFQETHHWHQLRFLMLKQGYCPSFIMQI